MYNIINILKQLLGNIPATMIILLISTNLLGGIWGVPTAIIGAISCLIFFLILLRGATIDIFMAAFLLYLPIELLLAQPDYRFHSWERMGVFVVMMTSFSPLLQSEYARRFRRQALQLVIFIIVICSIASFFAYFLGINLMIRNNSNEYIGLAGHFAGLFDHSMKLGPMASLASLFLMYKGFISQKKWLFLLSALCACAVLFSASRGSFIGLLVSTCFLMYKYSRNKAQLIKILITTFVLLVITYPIWSGAMEGLEQKQANNVAKGGTLLSRSLKWRCRINEFISSPIWGVGFSSINPNGPEYWNKTTGVIEPGTSWLAILSMTGMLGFILFMKIYLRAYNLVKKTMNDRSIILYSFVIFFSVHLIIEGYIFAAGNPVCIIFWLIIGCCSDMQNDSECEENNNVFLL